MLLQPYVTPSTALSLLEEATRMDAERLVDACLRVVAQQLPQLACEPLLADLVRESAAGVANREDVDSVPLVDDLRYHIAQLYGDGELSGELSEQRRITCVPASWQQHEQRLSLGARCSRVQAVSSS